METINNAIVENNLTFGSPSSAKSIGLNSNGDLEISSQGNNILFKDNTVSLRANPGAKIELDSNIHFNKPVYSECGIKLNNAKYIRGTKTSDSVHDIIGVSSSDNVNIGSNAMVTRLRGSSIYLRDTTSSVTSDKNLKKDFNTFDERYDNFFDKLKPTTFKYIFGNSGRTHSGFVAQDVEQALLDSNLTNQDIAIVDKISIKNREVEEDELGNITDVKNSSINYLLDNGYNAEYALRYTELIALLVNQVQKLKTRVSELENKLDERGN